VSGLVLELPAVPESVPRARAALDELRENVGADRLEDLRLVVSELVTNSIRHAGLENADSIDLRVEPLREAIRVQIHDRGPGFETPMSPTSMYQESGWGLYLVSRIAERWGVSSDASGTTVWLEIAR
jgi:anti-sigma regulatory factor (Ser/Thr protein kinase)